MHKMTRTFTELEQQEIVRLREYENKLRGFYTIQGKHADEMSSATHWLSMTSMDCQNLITDIVEKRKTIEDTKNLRINTLGLVIESFSQIDKEIERYKEDIRKFKLSLID